MDLILDVKIHIASFDQEAWIKMVLYDDEFCNYAYTINGSLKFIHYFKRVVNNQTFLFGKFHSIDDLPAITDANGNKYWYCNGKT